MSWNSVRETLGVFAVVAGLVFVGVEIRQNNSLARGQARQALADMTQEWLLTLTQDPEYYDLWRRAWVSCEVMTPNDSSRARLMMFGQIRRMENVFLQFSEGLVDQSALTAYGAAPDAPHFGCSHFPDFWDRWQTGYDSSFVEFFDRQLEHESG